MRRFLIFTLIFSFIISFGVMDSFAKAKREKFGKDERHELWKNKKFTTSKKVFHWRMVETWTKGILFHDVAQHFCDSVRAASGGRLVIKLYQAGALVPAMEVFDAVRKGVVECGHDWPGYWKGKIRPLYVLLQSHMGLILKDIIYGFMQEMV